MGLGQIRIVEAIGVMSFVLASGLMTALALSLIGALSGAFTGALLGGLLGALRHGLTGPDIESRTVPNQGIRQSAINVGGFALVGGLVLGTISGLVNLSFAALMTGPCPGTLRLVRLRAA